MYFRVGHRLRPVLFYHTMALHSLAAFRCLPPSRAVLAGPSPATEVMNVNTLFLISGPSGSGKTTIMRRLMDNEIVSFTTRPPRPGEQNGRDYIFITKEEFTRLSESNGLIEQTEYAGNYYGITRHEFESKLARGPAFAIVDAVGKVTLESLYPATVSIFIYADARDAIGNLKDRGESEEFIKKRLSTWLKEYQNRKMYNYVIRNNRGRLDDAVEVVRHIIRSEVHA
jgi:guanylate kinase